jgi:hypothetical protein
MTAALVILVLGLGALACWQRSRHYRGFQARQRARWDQVEKDGSIQ